MNRPPPRAADARPAAQAARAVLMVRPAQFGSNPQTLASNRFQRPGPPDAEPVAQSARRELDALAGLLTSRGITVHCFDGRTDTALPDEVFPNNWLSFHHDGTAVLYPMMAENRRAERRRDLLDTLQSRGYRIRRVLDLSAHERSGRYLEGTGSLVLDHLHRVAYACASPRTDPTLVTGLARELGYRSLLFDALDRDGAPIYHTNVLMFVGTRVAAICAAAIADRARRALLLEELSAGGREVIEIDFDQLEAFAGNMLELHGKDPVIAMSARARAALTPAQRRQLAAHAELLAADIATIESCGGGGVRCMLAEVHLPRDADAG